LLLPSPTPLPVLRRVSLLLRRILLPNSSPEYSSIAGCFAAIAAFAASISATVNGG
jgi:hypothetical protein